MDDPPPEDPPPDDPPPLEDRPDDDPPPEDDPPPDDDPPPLLAFPLPEEPDDEDCELAAGARYITDRTSSSIRRNMARANWARSTSACPADEYRQ
jgi:hypothetical protein